MRIVFSVVVLLLFFNGCNDNRTYQEFVDFEERSWLSQQKPEFEFNIDDAATRYNVYCHVRNSITYPYSRLFINYYLLDSTGQELKKNLVNDFLFDVKTGKPYGKSGLGDLYDQQIPILTNYQFERTGKYKMRFEQFMRTDTLQGIISVGMSVEKVKQ